LIRKSNLHLFCLLSYPGYYNGLQLYYRLKAVNRNIKILFVTALDAVPELTSILPHVNTTNDIIRKPVALADFISAVKTVLNR
jgi:DNA-binding response OmpR family regulator